jgi:hypothetical protein
MPNFGSRTREGTNRVPGQVKGRNMRKSLVTRILGLVVLYCAVFFVLIMLQFSHKGNFTLSTGEMIIKGRYLQAPANSPLYAAESSESGWQQISGGVKVFYGGIEINLTEGSEKGMVLTGLSGVLSPVNPDYMLIDEGMARFGLPGGTTLAFNSLETARGAELQISAEFAEDVFEIAIPIVNRRSSLIHENDQLGILYNGDRYFFGNSSWELENSKLVLSRDDSLISYRSRNVESVFDPSVYITAQSRDYENVLANWRDSSYAYWNRNASLLQNEDDIIAYLSESFRHNQFSAALTAIPRNFVNSSIHSFRSSGFVGGMTAAYSSIIAAEREKINRITNLTRGRSPDILMEEHVLDFLLTRSNSTLANEILEFIRDTEPETLDLDHCPGLLEIHSDFRRWRPAEVNFTEQFTEQILLLISENIHHDSGNDHVFVSHNESGVIENNPGFNLRLGKALLAWAEESRNTEWAEISRSLILSALAGGGVGAGNIYATLNLGDYYPKAVSLTDDGLWVWTVTPYARASYNAEGNLNISVSFPVNMAHYIIISGVRPFVKIQVHGTDWRTDSQFERYDSSGWVYYQQDQILIVKLRHRTMVENIGIFYRVDQPAPAPTPVPAPAPAPTPAPVIENNTNTGTGANNGGLTFGP